jgi:uncharacterized protein YuzE
MKAQYFKSADTLYIEFSRGAIVETRDLDEDTVIDLNANGRICAITMEHAGERTGFPHFSFEEVAA